MSSPRSATSPAWCRGCGPARGKVAGMSSPRSATSPAWCRGCGPAPRWPVPELGHEGEVLLVDLVAARPATALAAPLLVEVRPRSALLAVPSDVAGGAAAGAHHVVGHVRLVLALPRLVVRRAAVGALHHAVLAQCPVEQRELPQLHLAQLVGPLGHLHPLLDDLLDLVDGLLDALRVRGRDVCVQRLVLARQRLPVLPADLALLDAALAADDDLGAGVLLHVLESVTSRTDQKAHEVDVRMTVLRDHHLVANLDLGRLVVWRRFVLRINGQHPLDTLVSHLLQLLPLAVLAGVQPLAVRGVDRLGGWRPAIRQRLSSGHNTQLGRASHSAN